MRRWTIAWAVAVAAAAVVLLSHSTGGGLLADTDTKTLIETIRAKHAPFSWFWSDWPLYNHFYRPIPTLLFELDNALYGNNSAGYAWTNAGLASLCVVALFWLLRELTDRPIFALVGALLFAFWQSPWQTPLNGPYGPLHLAACATLAVGAWRHGRNVRLYLPAVLVLYGLSDLLTPLQDVRGTVIGWLPGRTASTMTLFALLAMAAYARYERKGGTVAQPAPITPLTPPATKSTRQTRASNSVRWPWAILGVLFAAASFASYEQAVMLPACLLAVAVTMRLQGYRPNWYWQAAFWGLILGYLEVRHQVIPPGSSQYQQQQIKRSFEQPLLDISNFAFPPIASIPNIAIQLSSGPYILLDLDVWATAIWWVATGTTYYQLKREWKLGLAGWGMAIVAFLPMAFLHIFTHYYYWPLALRTLLAVAAGSVAWQLVSIAWRPPERQAPVRPDPAPGSLPHP